MTSTTVVYTDELKPPSTGGPTQVRGFTVQMGNTQSGIRAPHLSSDHRHRGGSPKPKKRFSVKKSTKDLHSSYPSGYNPNVFTITAYLPYDGGKRLKLQCTPGQTVQQVIESGIPEFSTTGYQVYQFPSRALLNPEKDASVLQDQEISIEPMRSSSPDEFGDDRLSIVKELLKTEDTYLENLRNIFDIYMEPLKKWGLPQNEMNTMFRSLSRLCDLLMNFFSELELAVQHWSTTTTRIGGLFKQYRSFWDMYNEYSQSYTRACKLLKDKRVMDDSFNSFLELKRGAAMHTLESLMLLPVQRIYEYHKLLVQLYRITPKEHMDYSDLKYTVMCVGSIVQEREQQLVLNQNKAKLAQVQSRFPNDNLKLMETIEAIEFQLSSRRSKSLSHSTSQTSQHITKSRHSDMCLLDQPDAGHSTMRLYLTEGPVRIISGMQSHERFFFLFDDMLIIAKPVRKQKANRAQHKVYKRKEQVRLSEMWVTDCVDEVMESTLPPNTAFVVGWPMTNCLAAFSTPEEKILWFNQLSKNIASQRQTVKADKVSVQIVNLTKSSNNIPVWMQVHASETAKGVLLKAIELFAIAVASTNCQMWVKFSKDDGACPLIGHEHPFAIQMYHNRLQTDYIGSDKPVQLQFVIKRKSVLSTDPSVPRPGLKRQKFSFIGWAKSRNKRNPGLPKKKMFKVPLDRIIVNNQLPELLQEMLIRLYTEAPQTLGIFRQSANYRKVKDLKEAIDNQERVDLTNVSIHVIGALLKDLLRSVPGGILMSTRYTEFVATNDLKDISTRVLHLKKVISKLPDEHQLFLQYLFPLLHHIARNEDINCMNTINLAICFAPSLLWPDSGLDVIKNEVPPLVQFLVEHSPKIFGSELPEIYKQVTTASSPGVEKMELAFEQPSPSSSSLVPTKIEDGSECSHKRSESMDSSMSEEESLYNENKSNLLRTKRSGLTFSDSQLSTISQHDYEPTAVAGQNKVANVPATQGQQLGVPKPKRVKKIREPKRSSSLRGPNDYPPNPRVYYQRKQSQGEPGARRKSIAVQSLSGKKLKQEYVPGFGPIPDSPSGSLSSSSQDYLLPTFRVPQGTNYTDRHRDTYNPYDARHDNGHRHSGQKKRRLPQYSNSFSKGTENKPATSMSGSYSYYDKLLPLEPEAKTKSRSMATSLGTRHTRSGDNRDDGAELRMRVGSGPIFEDHSKTAFDNHTRQPLALYMKQQMSSNQSISSSRSGSSTSSHLYHQRSQNKPSNMSLASTGSAGSQGSPDLLGQMEQTPFNKMDKEFFKVAISRRFDLKDTQDTTSPQHLPIQQPSATTNTTSPYYTAAKEQPERVTPTHHKMSHYPGQSMTENIDQTSQTKNLKRQRVDSTASITSDASFSKSHSYQSFLSSQQKKDSLMSLTEAGLDDRPESDQHLHSLPRPHTAEFVRPEKMPTALYPPMAMTPQMLPVGAVLETVPDHDPNKLYPSSGYNSDTESSPSRTLSRPGKILEVMSPTKPNMPNRYYPSDSSRHGRTPYHQPAGRSNRHNKILSKHAVSLDEGAVRKENLPVSTPVQVGVSQMKEAQQTTLSDIPKSSTEETASKTVSKEIEEKRTSETTKTPRPKSGDSAKIGKLVETFSKPVPESPIVESAKVKLGLIPPRTRSKSTSEKEAMRIIHKIVEEDETAAKTAEEEERAEKHRAWASSAPTSADRKKAWESLSKDNFKRAEKRSRSLKHEGTPAVVDPIALRPSVTPELKRRSATMPEYLITGPRRARGNLAQVRTVTVVSYDAPKPERIRRINLRTYH